MPVDKKLLAAQNVQENKVGYDFNILNGNVFNRFAIVVNWTEQCKYKEKNEIKIQFNNTLIDQIKVDHNVVTIKKQKEIIYTGLSSSMRSDDRQFIAFKIFDEENKVIQNSSFADYLNIQKISGNAYIEPFKYDNQSGQFNALIQP